MRHRARPVYSLEESAVVSACNARWSGDVRSVARFLCIGPSPFRDGAPSCDRLADIFATPEAEKMRLCRVSRATDWADVLGVDGKTRRVPYRSAPRSPGLAGTRKTDGKNKQETRFSVLCAPPGTMKDELVRSLTVGCFFCWFPAYCSAIR